MPEIPEPTALSFWLFKDNFVADCEYKFVSFEPRFKTKNGKEIPVFVLYGKLEGKEKQIQAEVRVASFNIVNLKELMTTLGKNTDSWADNLFFKVIPEDNKFKFVVCESVK